MDDKEKKLLEQTYELAKENNVILQKIRGHQKRAVIFRVAYWLIIVSFVYGAYFYIEPYVQKFLTLYSSSNQSLQRFVFPEVDQINAIFNNSAKKVNGGN